jgi:hypothetical protein
MTARPAGIDHSTGGGLTLVSTDAWQRQLTRHHVRPREWCQPRRMMPRSRAVVTAAVRSAVPSFA